MLKGTPPASPTIYKVAVGNKYNELKALAIWDDPDAMLTGYTAFTSYVFNEAA